MRFLLDESVYRPVADALHRHNRLGGPRIEFAVVGQGVAPPLGSPDPILIEWAAVGDFVLVSRDYKTMASHLSDFLASGRRSPGVLLLRPNTSIRAILDVLIRIETVGAAETFAETVTWIP